MKHVFYTFKLHRLGIVVVCLGAVLAALLFFISGWLMHAHFATPSRAGDPASAATAAPATQTAAPATAAPATTAPATQTAAPATTAPAAQTAAPDAAPN